VISKYDISDGINRGKANIKGSVESRKRLDERVVVEERIFERNRSVPRQLFVEILISAE